MNARREMIDDSMMIDDMRACLVRDSVTVRDVSHFFASRSYLALEINLNQI